MAKGYPTPLIRPLRIQWCHRFGLKTPVSTGSKQTVPNAQTMVVCDFYVQACMRCIIHDLMNILSSYKQPKTINNARNMKIEFKNFTKPVRAREHDLG